MASLDHPGIVRVYDYGAVPKRAAAAAGGICCRWAARGSRWSSRATARSPIGRRSDRGRSWCDLAAQVLDGLAHSHARDIVHRDLKPRNVLLHPASEAHRFGRITVTDFGIAHALTRRSSVHAQAGTPGYMAPEQIRGAWRDQGPWTDLYALGCLAWRMLVGRGPFPGRLEERRAARAARRPDHVPRGGDPAAARRRGVAPEDAERARGRPLPHRGGRAPRAAGGRQAHLHPRPAAATRRLAPELPSDHRAARRHGARAVLAAALAAVGARAHPGRAVAPAAGRPRRGPGAVRRAERRARGRQDAAGALAGRTCRRDGRGAAAVGPQRRSHRAADAAIGAPAPDRDRRSRSRGVDRSAARLARRGGEPIRGRVDRRPARSRDDRHRDRGHGRVARPRRSPRRGPAADRRRRRPAALGRDPAAARSDRIGPPRPRRRHPRPGPDPAPPQARPSTPCSSARPRSPSSRCGATSCAGWSTRGSG